LERQILSSVNGVANPTVAKVSTLRTLLDGVPGSAFKYVRDLTLYPGSTIGEHPHSGDEEIYFIISGSGVMVVSETDQKASLATRTREALVGCHLASLAPHGARPLGVN